MAIYAIMLENKCSSLHSAWLYFTTSPPLIRWYSVSFIFLHQHSAFLHLLRRHVWFEGVFLAAHTLSFRGVTVSKDFLIFIIKWSDSIKRWGEIRCSSRLKISSSFFKKLQRGRPDGTSISMENIYRCDQIYGFRKQMNFLQPGRVICKMSIYHQINYL